MKVLKATVLSAALLFSQLTLAAPKTAAAPANFVVNPTTLQTQLLSYNNDVIQGLNSVHMAKDEVNIARGNLLPSLNLSGMLSMSGSGFLMSTVDFLVPFLVPSNWYNYYSEKAIFESEKISYNLIQLNTYSSSLSMYYTILSDRQVQQIYQKQYLDLQQIFELQKRRSNGGGVPVSDLLQTQAQAQMAGVRASQLAALNKQEIASIRKSLALPLTTNIQLDNGNTPASNWEYENPQAAIDQANKVSLEIEQLRRLITAAKNMKWSAAFAFINSFTFRSTTNGVDNARLRDANLYGSLNFGFAQYPAYELTQDQLQSLVIQQSGILQENTRAMESALATLSEAKNQLDMATQAEAQMAQVYQIKLQNYDQGIETLTNVLLSSNDLADASVAKSKANLEVNLQRVLIHRILRTSYFANIKGCQPVRMPVRPTFWGRITGKVDANATTLDQICKGK